jgi:single-strand DNA-binding protein
MSGLPVMTVAGTLVADGELRFTPAGVATAGFTVACNERKFDRQSGQWSDGSTTFVRCQLWRQAAENFVESTSRGDRVMATGVLKQREFTTREGEKRTVFELDVEEIAVSLKFATAKVNKVSRSGSSGSSGGATADDPWAGSGDDGGAPF